MRAGITGVVSRLPPRRREMRALPGEAGDLAANPASRQTMPGDISGCRPGCGGAGTPPRRGSAALLGGIVVVEGRQAAEAVLGGAGQGPAVVFGARGLPALQG